MSQEAEVVQTGTEDAAAQAAAAAAAKPTTVIDEKAPVVPAKPDKKNEPEPIEYAETGDPKLDLALGFFGRNGLDAEHAAIKAAVQGDFSLLEAELASKGAQGWQQYVALAKESHGNAVKASQEADAAITGAVAKTLEQFGYTNEQWGEAIQWVRTESPEEVPEINKLLASGPLGARAITAFILSNHRDASGVEYTPQQKAVKDEAGTRSGPAPAEVKPISKSDFGREAEKLARSLGPDYLHSPEYKALRKAAGIGRQ